MNMPDVRKTVIITLAICGALSAAAPAQMPTHPVITEVFTDPPGLLDGPVGRDPTNLHQGFIEIYLPTLAALDPALNKEALALTFYEVEGDFSSSGNELVNYRIDLPPIDFNPANGTTPGAIPRPSSGVVVIGWVDYVGNPPTDLAGTPATRVALINGGVTSTTDFTFIALNGAQFTGTTNFPVPLAVSLINMPGEATSGIIQNGSAAYLLVNRDAAGYVELYDDKDTAHVPPLANADPSLATGTVLGVSALLDGMAANDHFRFDVLQQPYLTPTGKDIDLETVLPFGGAFSLLVPQVDENAENGYARLFLDIVKTTEDGIASNENPVVDALGAYRTIANVGPFFPTPGRVPSLAGPPELAVALPAGQLFDVLAGTTGRPGIVAANVGGNFGIDVTAVPGASSNPATAAFGPAGVATVLTGQTLVHPSIAITVPASGAAGALATAPITVSATNTNGLDPAVVNPVGATTATATVLNPTTGLDAGLLPFQATVFAAIQGLPRQSGVPNEFAGTSLAQFVANNLLGLVDDERNNGLLLIDPLTDLSDPFLVDAMEDDMPDLPTFFINVPSPAGLDDLVTTILNSAERTFGNKTYDDNFNATMTAVRAVELNIAETATSGGVFVPTERIHFVDPVGVAGSPASGLTNATSMRGFELALLDSNVQQLGTLESGQTDDFGLIVEVGRTRSGAAVVPGEFVFLSFTGGLEGADIDTLDVPPHNNQTNIIYLDLDLLDTILGCETITRLFVIDGSGGNTVNIIEAFSLNVAAAAPNPCPTITQQPVDRIACPGGSATFTVGATGLAPLTYQWRKDGVVIAGATGTSLTVNPAQVGDAGLYDVVVSNSCGTAVSNAASLTIANGPTILTQPQSQDACNGGTATFTVTASGPPPLSFQWRKSGAAISGETSATLNFSAVQSSDSGVYDVVVTGPCGTATSNSATLTLSGTAPAIVGQPQGQTLCAGGTVVLTAVANGTAPLSFQWRRNGAAIVGATTASLVLNAVQANDAGVYDVIVSNLCGSVVSGRATVTVQSGPGILQHPQIPSVCVGGVAALTVTASGTGPLHFQWRRNLAPIAGATGSSFTVNAGSTGSYDVVVTNACGSVTSSAAVIADRDLDGTFDGCDQCPDDANKITPDVCGCGISDRDTDGDTLADCVDPFPNDPSNMPPPGPTTPPPGGSDPPGTLPPVAPPPGNTPPMPAPMSAVTGGGFCGAGAGMASALGLLCFLGLSRRRRMCAVLVRSGSRRGRQV